MSVSLWWALSGLQTLNLNLMGLPGHHECEPVGLKAIETAWEASHEVWWISPGPEKLARETGNSSRGLADQLGVWRASHKVLRALRDKHWRNSEISIWRNYDYCLFYSLLLTKYLLSRKDIIIIHIQRKIEKSWDRQTTLFEKWIIQRLSAENVWQWCWWWCRR